MQRAPGLLRDFLGGRLDATGNLLHKRLKILKQDPRFAQIFLHHRRVIQSSEGARKTKAVKTGNNPNDIRLVFLDKSVRDLIWFGSSFAFHDRLLPNSNVPVTLPPSGAISFSVFSVYSC